MRIGESKWWGEILRRKIFQIKAFLLFSVFLWPSYGQNLGGTAYQQTVENTLAGSLLYHFVAHTGTIDTALSLSNVRIDPLTAPTPGTFEILMFGDDGTFVRAHSNQLKGGVFNLVGSTDRGLQATAAFFLGDVFADLGLPPTTRFVGYVRINHSFTKAAGTAQVMDLGAGRGFRIGYTASEISTAPVIKSISPSPVDAGVVVTLSVSGENFFSGLTASITTDDGTIVVPPNDLLVDSSSQIRIRAIFAEKTAAYAATITVKNPDGQNSSGIVQVRASKKPFSQLQAQRLLGTWVFTYSNNRPAETYRFTEVKEGGPGQHQAIGERLPTGFPGSATTPLPASGYYDFNLKKFVINTLYGAVSTSHVFEFNSPGMISGCFSSAFIKRSDTADRNADACEVTFTGRLVSLP
ncbi:MAG TPA: hypothetical protein VGK99_01450 [Acidobacteriota bacterium]